MARALVSALGYPTGAPEFDWYDIPFKNGMKPHPFLLPRKFLNALYDVDRERWSKVIRGPRAAAEQFGDIMGDSPFLVNHPDLPVGERSKTIPIGIHGDGGSFFLIVSRSISLVGIRFWAMARQWPSGS